MLIVKKFGGTSVANKERIFNVANRCIEDYKKGNDVIVVLSAMGKQTDVLLEMAADINPNASKRELDMLLTTGEQTSVALMSMALHSLGVPAISLNAFQVAMHTTSVSGNARLTRIDKDRVRHELEQRTTIRRNAKYNWQMGQIERLEKEGRIYVLRPLIPTVSRLEKDYDMLMNFYEHGYCLMKREYDGLMKYLEGGTL